MKKLGLDTFDAKILTLLQGNTRITAQSIADAVGLSPAACQKRVKRLRASGLIEAEVAIVSPKAAGMNITAVVQVRVARDSLHELDRFKKLMWEAPEVMQCYYVTGEHNFVVHVVVPDMADYEDFSRRYFIEDTGVSHFITSVVMDRVKGHGVIHVAPDQTDQF